MLNEDLGFLDRLPYLISHDIVVRLTSNHYPPLVRRLEQREHHLEDVLL